MDPEDSEVCLRYILAYAKRRGSRIFEIFSTQEKTDHLAASRNRCLENEGKRVALQERWQSEWEGVNCEGTDSGKGATVPRKKNEDAAAAAEIFINEGGRKPVEICGR